jgi:hypothetical protein
MVNLFLRNSLIRWSCQVILPPSPSSFPTPRRMETGLETDPGRKRKSILWSSRITCIPRESMLKKSMLHRLFISFLLLWFLLPIGVSSGFEAKGQECSKCHTLGKDEARDLLKNVIPDVVIFDIRLSPVKGVWEVDLESRGRKAIVYVDFLKKHFFSGALVSIDEKKNLTQERFIELNRVDVSKIPLEDALVMGYQKARIRVIVFTDPD